MANKSSFEDMIDFQSISSLDGAEYAKRIQWAYSRVLDAAGINMVDPVVANMRYFNVWNHKPNVEPARVGKTYIFMTRPDCNFGDRRNFFTVPYFRLAASTEMGRILMSYLMAPTVFSKNLDVLPEIPGIELNKQVIADAMTTSPFIPIVTNLCVESNGGKDLVMETHETDADFAGNKQQYASGFDETETVGELTLNFEDIKYNPALFLTYLHVLYMHNASRGTATVQKQYVVNRVINYTSSIYIFMTDSDGETLIRWQKYTGCFPRTVPFGLIQHNTDVNIEAFRKFSVTYAYNRSEAMKPQVLMDFNRLCRPFVSSLLTGAKTSEILTSLQAGVGGIPRKVVPDPYQAPNAEVVADKMRGWYGGHPYILGNKLIFLRPDDVVSQNRNQFGAGPVSTNSGLSSLEKKRKDQSDSNEVIAREAFEAANR